jgi:hypothetical protein
MKFPIIEIVDRYCIAIVKSVKTNNANAEEVKFYSEQMDASGIPKLHPLVRQLIQHHEYVWSLEDDFKKCRIDSLPLEEIGRRALHIRDVGFKRVELKNALAELANDPVREIKQDHITE